jgi:hypothetical protein
MNSCFLWMNGDYLSCYAKPGQNVTTVVKWVLLKLSLAGVSPATTRTRCDNLKCAPEIHEIVWRFISAFISIFAPLI